MKIRLMLLSVRFILVQEIAEGAVLWDEQLREPMMHDFHPTESPPSRKKEGPDESG